MPFGGALLFIKFEKLLNRFNEHLSKPRCRNGNVYVRGRTLVEMKGSA
jgi:hypothetical protein